MSSGRSTAYVASLFRYSDQILFYHEDGAGVGDVDAKAETRDIDSGEQVAEEEQMRRRLE